MTGSLNKIQLQDLLAKSSLSQLDKILIVLSWDKDVPKTVAKIREIASAHGLRECAKWNISTLLSRSKGKAISLKEGWQLTTAGRNYLKTQKYIDDRPSILKNDVADLRNHLAKIKDANSVSFLEEAISCLEANQKRAAVVFSWIGAVSILYDHVITYHLAPFNTEALKRDAKWKNAKTADDLGKIKEFDFLNILEAISVIGKNVKQELQNCLQLRNGCGHPNSLKIGERKVAAHIEILILNVFSKF